MPLPPSSDHLSLYTIVLCPKIPPDATGPAIHFHRFQKCLLDSSRAFVVHTFEVYDETRVPIDAPMDVEAPGMKFLIPIMVPESV